MQDSAQNNDDHVKAPDAVKHPGSVLRDVLSELGLTPRQIANQAGLSPIYVNQLIAGKASIAADAAVRLATFTDIEAKQWMDLQVGYDLARAAERFETDISTFPGDDRRDVEQLSNITTTHPRCDL